MTEQDIIKSQEKCEDLRVIASEIERELARNPPDRERILKATRVLTLIAEDLDSLAK